MTPYFFALETDGAVEELGFMALRDDDAAVAFAESVARDLAKAAKPGSRIAVIKGARAVHRIAVE